MLLRWWTLRKIWGESRGSLGRIHSWMWLAKLFVFIHSEKVKVLILWASDVSSCSLSLSLFFFFIPRGEIFWSCIPDRGQEAQRREAMWQCTRLSGHLFQGASDLEALRASHRRANRGDKGWVCLCNEALLLVQQGGSAYQIQFGSERLNLHRCLL